MRFDQGGASVLPPLPKWATDCSRLWTSVDMHVWVSDWGVMYSILSFHRSQNCCVWAAKMFARSPYYLEPQLCALACHPRRLFYRCYTGRPLKTCRQRRPTHAQHVHVSASSPFLGLACFNSLPHLFQGIYASVLPPTLVGAMSSYSTPSWVNTQPVVNLHGSSHLEEQNGGMSLREQMQKKADAIYGTVN